MNGVQSHLHVPTHANIYLGMQSLHTQSFKWLVNKLIYSFTSVLIPNRLIIVSVYHRLGDCNKNQFC